jgi:hypothetical protein
MLKSNISRRLATTALVLFLSLLMLLLFIPLPAMGGTIAGNFTPLASSPMNITAFTVDPTTGLMYGQEDGNTSAGTHYYEYNPSTNAWSTLATCPQPSGNNAGAIYLNGNIYISYTGTTNLEVYHIGSDSWSTITGGVGTGAISTDGSDIYVSGSAHFQKWVISSSQWVTLTAGTTQAWGGLQYRNGYFYSDDGNGSIGFNRYNVATNTWTALSSVPGGAVLGSAIFDAYYYCMGSYGGTNLYSYDLGAEAWNNTLTLPFSINDSSIVVYQNSLYIIQGEAGGGFSRFTPNNPILSSIEGTPTTYTIGDSPKIITASITGADNDDTEWESGTVSVTGNFQSGKDVLAFTTQNGISGSWNSTTGVLSLTGETTIANWISAFRSVTYSNNSLTSTANTRTISFQVRDGEQNSNVQSRGIVLTVPPPPDIDVQGNGISIVSGDTTPSTADFTDFGSTDMDSGSIVRTFTIRNTGTSGLDLTGSPKVVISGTNAVDFGVTTLPSSPVGGGASTTFQVTFDPSSTGNRAATVSIASNDPDENPYTFSIQGKGTKLLTVSGITAGNKEYDGTNTATLNTGSAALVGIVSGDTVSLNNGSAAAVFADKNVGAGKTVTISGLTIGGADAGNYSLTQPTTIANITARAITVKAINSSKTYDGTTASAGVPSVISGSLASGDTVTWTQIFDNKNVGINKILTPAGAVSDGNAGNNYTVTFTTIGTGTITTRAITVTAVTGTKAYDGTTGSTGMPTIIFGTLATGDTGTWTQTFNTKYPETNKTLTPAGVVNDGNGGSNYDVTFATVDTGTITARAITVTASTDSKSYNGTTISTGTPTITVGSLVAGDSAVWTQTFNNKNVGTNKTITPAGTVSDGSGGSNYSITFASVATGTITAKPLTVSGVTAGNKEYDGTTAVTLNTGTAALVGIVSGDTVSLNNGSATAVFADKNVGTGKTVTISGLTIGGADAENYSLTQPTTTANITARAITVKAINNSKTYDGTTASAGAPSIISGSLASGDTVAWTQAFDTKNVGVNKTLTPAGAVSDGNAGNNYTVTFTTVGTGTITTRAITVTAVTGTKAYDGTTSSTGMPTITTGSLATGDSATWTQTFASKLVETNKTLTPAGVVNDGNGGNNYIVTFATVDTGTITARTITVTASTDSKAYNGTTNSTGIPTITVGSLVAGDSAVWTQTFNNKNVGTNKTITPAGTVSDGSGGSNYSVTFAIVATGTITARPLTVSGVTAGNKEYDGTTAVTLNTGTAALVGIVSGDTVSLNNGSAAAVFADKNVGAGKTVTISGLTIGGADAGNYSLTQPTTTANITAKNLTVTAVTDSKEYNGTTISTGTPTITVGSLVVGDSAIWTQTFSNKNAGTSKTITPSGTVSDGNSGNNYNVTFTTVDTGTITARAMTVIASADSKGYDGTVSSTGTPTITTGSLATGDTVTWIQTFDNKNVGSGKTLTPTGTVSDGNSGNNYNVTLTAVSTGTVTARAITVTALTDTRQYNGTASSTGIPTISAGSFATGDSATWTQTFDNKNIGTNKTITPAGTVSDGSGGSNYSVTFASVATGAITAKPLTVSGVTANNKEYDGTTAVTLNTGTVALVGIVSGDTVSLNTTAAGVFTDKAVGTGKTVTVSGLTIGGADAGNYSLSQPTTTANITSKAITVTGITANNKQYDGTITATLNTGSGTLVGVISGDTVSLTGFGIGVFTDKTVGTGKTVNVSGLTAGGTDGANYALTQPMPAANITVKTLAVSGITSNDKPYDGTAVATLNIGNAALEGLVLGDTVTLNATSAVGLFVDINVGSGKTVTISGLTIGGTDVANYTLVQPTTTANITDVNNGGGGGSGGGGGWGPAPTPTATTTPTTTPTTTVPTSTTTPPVTTMLPYIIPVTTTTATTTTSTVPSTTGTPALHQLKVNIEGQTGTVTINDDGLCQGTASVTSTDKNIGIIIPNGTAVLTRDNTASVQITITPDPNPPSPPVAFNLVGVPYNCLPSGTTFSPPITLVWHYDKAELATGTEETKLQVCLFNEASGQWETVPGVVDTVNKTISATISHFTIYGVIAPAAVTMKPALVQSTTSKYLWIGIVIFLIVVVMAIILARRKKKSKKS